MSYNRVVIVGNAVRDPELKTVGANETSLCELAFAVNERQKVNGEWEKKTTFLDVTFWGRTAEMVDKYVEKGTQVLIEGRLDVDKWEKDGKKYSKVKVVGDTVRFVGGRKDS